MGDLKIIPRGFRVLVCNLAVTFLIAKSVANGATLEEVYAFPSGSNPKSTLLQARDGNIYGTTYGGGGLGFGSIFRMTPGGSVTTLFSFNKTNGANPYAGLIQGADGNFYGTTERGGIYDLGSVFRFATNGVLTTFVSFDSGYSGARPYGALVQDSDGSFYGTTITGGNPGDGTVGGGTIFRVTTNGNFTILIAMKRSEGAQAQGTLIKGNDGAFYGTFYVGGVQGVGLVYRVTTNGIVSSLYDFSPLAATGANPWGGLVLGTDGKFYGTTQGGGGKVFSLSTNGNFTLLHSMLFNGTQGRSPVATLLLGADGAFYGTAAWDSGGHGTIFRITPSGAFTNLVFFRGTNGSAPYSGLIQANDGSLYGTTSAGGSRGGGNIFRVNLGSKITSLTRFGDFWRIRFSGLPDVSYRLLRSTEVTGPWISMGSTNTALNGIGEFTDRPGSAPKMFYRCVNP